MEARASAGVNVMAQCQYIKDFYSTTTACSDWWTCPGAQAVLHQIPVLINDIPVGVSNAFMKWFAKHACPEIERAVTALVKEDPALAKVYASVLQTCRLVTAGVHD